MFVIDLSVPGRETGVCWRRGHRGRRGPLISLSNKRRGALLCHLCPSNQHLKTRQNRVSSSNLSDASSTTVIAPERVEVRTSGDANRTPQRDMSLSMSTKQTPLSDGRHRPLFGHHLRYIQTVSVAVGIITDSPSSRTPKSPSRLAEGHAVVQFTRYLRSPWTTLVAVIHVTAQPCARVV